MGEVVEGKFNQKVDMVYECPFCKEGQKFWIDEGGTISCISCSSKQLPPEGWTKEVLEAWDKRTDD